MPVPGLVVIFATHTRQKVAEFKLVLQNIGTQKGIPTLTLQLKQLFSHGAAVEDGASAIRNAEKKKDEAEQAVPHLLDPYDDAHKQLVQACANNGLTSDPRYTILASEDSVTGIPTAIAAQFIDKLRKKGVNASLLENISSYTHEGRDYSLLIDYGQIKEAIGPYKFHELLRQVAHESGLYKNNDVPILDMASVSWSRLSDNPAAPRREPILVCRAVLLYAPHGLDQKLEKPEGLIQPKHFHCLPEDKTKPIGDQDNYLQHVLEDGFRSAIIEELFPLASAGLPQATYAAAGHATTKRSLRNPRIVSLTKSNYKVPPHKGLSIADHAPKSFDEFSSLLACELSKKPGVGNTPDVIVIPPYVPKNDDERVKLNFMLANIVIAKQIDPRFLHTEVIMMNKDGCFDEFLATSDELSNAGLNGNYWRYIDVEFNRAYGKDHPNVTLYANSYFTVIRGHEQKSITAAAHDYIRHALRGMTRSAYKPEPPAQGENNQNPGDEQLVVVPFMSATNENKSLSRNAARLGKIALKAGYHILYGGMTKGPGAALLKVARSITTAVSTSALLKTESDGRFAPGLAAWFLYSTIEKRARHLIDKGDAFMVLDGGIGTLQEVALVMLARKMEPQKYGHKPIIFVIPDAASPVAHMINLLFGKERANRMINRPDKIEDKGIHVVKSVNAARSLLSVYAWDKKQRISSAPRPRTTPSKSKAASLTVT